LPLTLSAERVPDEEHCPAPAITVTEDNSIPVDDDEFVEYYGLQAYVEGMLFFLHFIYKYILFIIIISFVSGNVAGSSSSTKSPCFGTVSCHDPVQG